MNPKRSHEVSIWKSFRESPWILQNNVCSHFCPHPRHPLPAKDLHDTPTAKRRVAGALTLMLVFLLSILIICWSSTTNGHVEILLGSFGSPDHLRFSDQHQLHPVNVTERILEQLRANGTTPCHLVGTNYTLIPGLCEGCTKMDTEISYPVLLPTDKLHEFIMISYSGQGVPRCAGGDYYETDLVSPNWHSRPPIQDLGNGSYRVSFIIDATFAGLYNFTATLLFDAFHGLEHMTRPWDKRIQTVFLQIMFFDPNQIPTNSREPQAPQAQKSLNGTQPEAAAPLHLHQPENSTSPKATAAPRSEIPKQCRIDEDFKKRKWEGRWSRQWVNDSCAADRQGRYTQCLPEDRKACQAPWCDGEVAALESNGWVYSAHCAFHIFKPKEAWDCLNGRWILFWGDSNFQDTIRNLFLFILKLPVPYPFTLSTFQLARSFEQYFVNPDEPDQFLHISMIFNGHYFVENSGLGLDSLQSYEYRQSILKHFEGKTSMPDTLILNSGLHDGGHFPTVASYVDGVDRAITFWEDIITKLPAEQQKLMRLVYRTTVAPAGDSRGMQSNPHKMEVFNDIMVERLQEAAFPHHPFQIVDAFDLTFPWHYDNNYSDGGHYGRAPNVNKWPWFGQPHHYFVDLMLAHVLLNALCPSNSTPPS